jgi:hypothetical protein
MVNPWDGCRHEIRLLRDGGEHVVIGIEVLTPPDDDLDDNRFAIGFQTATWPDAAGAVAWRAARRVGRDVAALGGGPAMFATGRPSVTQRRRSSDFAAWRLSDIGPEQTYAAGLYWLASESISRATEYDSAAVTS